MGTTGPVNVREALRGDLTAVAEIHKSRFSTNDYLLGQYSVSLIRAFYGLFLTDAFFFVHTNSKDEVDAFVMGGEADVLRAGKRRFARAYAARLAWETLLRPRLWGIALRGAWGMLAPAPDQSEKNVAAPPIKNVRLLSIAVADDAEGTGAAVALVREFDDHLRRSCDGYELTVMKTNTRARKFYEKLAFSLAGETAQEYIFRKKFRE